MDKDREKRLASEDVKKLLISFSIPSIVGMLVNALYTIVDRVFIGNMPGAGEYAITGVGLTLPINNIIMAFGMLIAVGAAASSSIKMGEKRKDKAENILGNAFFLLLVEGIALSIVCLIFDDQILKVFGASENTLPYARSYMTIILLGVPFNILANGMNNLIRAEGSPKISMYTMLLGAILNTILDPIFIFVFNMGVQGAAIATIISQIASCIWVLWYYFGGKSLLKIKKENMKLNPKVIKTIVSIGMAPFAMQIAASIISVLSNRSLKLYGGDLAIGAMTVVNSVSMLIMMPIFGINQGAQPILGFNYGAHEYKRVRGTLKHAIIFASTICIFGFFMVQLFPENIIRFFNSSGGLIDVGVPGIRIFLSMLPVIGFQVISSNFFQAIGRAKISMFLSMTRQVIFLIPLLLILPKIGGLGLTGVWLAGPTADALASIVTFILLMRELKILNKKEKNMVQRES